MSILKSFKKSFKFQWHGSQASISSGSTFVILWQKKFQCFLQHQQVGGYSNNRDVDGQSVNLFQGGDHFKGDLNSQNNYNKNVFPSPSEGGRHFKESLPQNNKDNENREDGGNKDCEFEHSLPHPIWTPQELEGVVIDHKKPAGIYEWKKDESIVGTWWLEMVPKKSNER